MLKRFVRVAVTVLGVLMLASGLVLVGVKIGAAAVAPRPPSHVHPIPPATPRRPIVSV